MGMRLGELAARIGARLAGDADRLIEGVATLEEAGPADLAFAVSPRYRPALAHTAAGAVIVPAELAGEPPPARLISDNPYLAYARAAALLVPEAPAPSGVHPGAWVDASARLGGGCSVGPGAVIEADVELGDGVVVGPGCWVGRGSRIGAGTRLFARVSVYPGCRIGRRCRLHAGVVVGADGFGYARDGARWVAIPQLGGVRIGDDVHIGANTTIDRGTLRDTVIGDGVILDNQIQIAHNVEIGEHTAMAGCVAVAGSTRIGRRCAFGGRVGILDHLEIADDVQVMATSLVSHSLTRPGVYSSALPVEEVRRWRRTVARLRGLDALARRLRALERSIQRLLNRRDA